MPRIKFPSTDIRTRKEKNNTPENRSTQEKITKFIQRTGTVQTITSTSTAERPVQKKNRGKQQPVQRKR